MTIRRFRDEYFFMSSMYPNENGVVGPQGMVGPSAEHGYQADKFTDPAIQAQIMNAPDGFSAKRMANRFKDAGHEIRPDWEEKKVDIMRGYVRQKFERDLTIRGELADTGDEEIIEGNNRGDRVWGVCPPESDNGQNLLGHILMDTRAEIVAAEYATTKQTVIEDLTVN